MKPTQLVSFVAGVVFSFASFSLMSVAYAEDWENNEYSSTDVLAPHSSAAVEESAVPAVSDAPVLAAPRVSSSAPPTVPASEARHAEAVGSQGVLGAISSRPNLSAKFNQFKSTIEQLSSHNLSSATKMKECLGSSDGAGEQGFIPQLQQCNANYDTHNLAAAQAVASMKGLQGAIKSAFNSTDDCKKKNQEASAHYVAAIAECSKVTGVAADFKNVSFNCTRSCNASLITDQPDPNGGYPTIGDIQTAQNTMNEMQKFCVEATTDFFAQVNSNLKTTSFSAASCGATSSGFKTVAITGGAMLAGKMLAKSNEEKSNSKSAANTGEGYAADGTNCLSPDTYSKDTCKPVLLKYCAKTENSNAAGCGAFNSLYCSSAEASQAYCLSGAAQNYCKQLGDAIQSSPACQWMSSRPSSCATSPDGIECLTKLAPDYLTTECPKYPNDPLCQSHMSGKIVTQPLTGADANQVAGNTTSTDKTTAARGTSSDSLNAIIGVGANNQASLSSLSSSGNSILQSNSAAYASLCQHGKLINCK